MPATRAHFTPELFAFLGDLKAHNDRPWFEAHRGRYEEHVLHPALQFVSDFGPLLKEISPHFQAIPKVTGGSLFRIHRDTRFAKDKSPYKTAVGIRFFHRRRKEIQAPVFYLHLEPGGCFCGLGVYHPDREVLARIRQAVAGRPDEWRRALADPALSRRFHQSGDALVRPPKGFDPDHPLIDEIKRKDFVAAAELSDADATAPGLLGRYADLCRAGAGYVRFLCQAVGVEF
jgi:uncharacterized protein (TIGR02453 family)